MPGWRHQWEEDCGKKCQRWVVTRDSTGCCEHEGCNIAVFTRTLLSILHSQLRNNHLFRRKNRMVQPDSLNVGSRGACRHKRPFWFRVPIDSKQYRSISWLPTTHFLAAKNARVKKHCRVDSARGRTRVFVPRAPVRCGRPWGRSGLGGVLIQRLMRGNLDMPYALCLGHTVDADRLAQRDMEREPFALALLLLIHLIQPSEML